MTDAEAVLRANNKALWDALRLIWDAVAELAPPGTLPSREKLEAEPMQEAEHIVRAIHVIGRHGGEN